MRVLVELMDKEPIQNVLGACIFEPDIIVFLCDENTHSIARQAAVYKLLRRRRLKSQPRFYFCDANSPAEIRKVLAAVVRDYPDCVFEYTGGHDLMLLQAGAYCLPLGVPGFCVDIQAGRFLNIQHCRPWQDAFRMPAFMAEDVFALTGAAIQGSGHFADKELESRGFEADILAVWHIVEENPKVWSQFVAYLQAICAGTALSTLDAVGPRDIKSSRHPAKYTPIIFEKLYKTGVFARYREDGKQVKFTFKSALHKKCLLNQGIWLELYCYIVAKQADIFDDVRTSVVVDWAGQKKGELSTKNEVDVMLVKGVVPVFVSCKMSPPTPLALSEIRLLSAKFGGELSRTVVLTGSSLGAENKALQARAKDLGILLLDDAQLERTTLVRHLAQAVEGGT